MSAGIITRLHENLFSLDSRRRLDIALNCLDSFVGANFAGVLDVEPCGELAIVLNEDDISALSFSALSFDFNKPFFAVRNIELLFISKEILERELSAYSPLSMFIWTFWLFRCYRIWSSILSEKSLQLKSMIDILVGRLDNLVVNDNNVSPQLHYQYQLEKSSFKSEFFEHSQAREALEKAAQLVRLDVHLDGALGRRTRFQLTSLAQLIVSTKSNASINENFPEESDALADDLPCNCSNADDTLLDKLKLDDNNIRVDSASVSDWHLLYMLDLGLEKFHACTELDLETSLAFIEEVIFHRKNWAIQIRALIERSVLERKNKRRVERACSQMESISRLLDGFECGKISTEKRIHRLRLIYSTSPLPFYTVRCIHADVLCSLGCIAEALMIYESLQMWDNVVSCYKSLNQLEKAEQIVRDMLEKDSGNAAYHCILGDITNNPKCYIEAIRVSNNKCARASASMGHLFLCRKEYAKACEAFKRSVELQPYQIGVWYNLGHCATKINDFKEATRAYHRCVSFEPEHFEAWNNLAACYVEMGQKERAQKVLQESIKLKHDNWNVWENLVLISVDIGDFRTALLAIKRLLDMDAKRHIDELPLQIIVDKTLTMPAEEVSRLREFIAETLARVVARQSVGSHLTRLYAELTRPADDSDDQIAWSKYVELLEKALQKEITEQSTKDEESYASQLENTVQLIDAMRNVWRINNYQDEQINSTTKLRIRPLVTTIEKMYGSQCKNAQTDRLKAAFTKASSLIV